MLGAVEAWVRLAAAPPSTIAPIDDGWGLSAAPPRREWRGNEVLEEGTLTPIDGR